MRTKPMSADSTVPNLQPSAFDSIDLFTDIPTSLPNTTDDLLTGDMPIDLGPGSLLAEEVLLEPNGLDFLQDAHSIQMIERMLQPMQDAQSAPEDEEGVLTDGSFEALAPTLDEELFDDTYSPSTLNELVAGEPQKGEDAGQAKDLDELFAAELKLLQESLGLRRDGYLEEFQADAPGVIFGFELGRDNSVAMRQSPSSLLHTDSAIASAHTVVNPTEPNAYQAQQSLLTSRMNLRDRSVMKSREGQDKQSNQFHPYHHALRSQKKAASVVSECVTSKKCGKPKKRAPVALEFLTPAEQVRRLENKRYAQEKRDREKAEHLYHVEQLQIARQETVELQQEIMALKIQLGMLLCPPDLEDAQDAGLSMAAARTQGASKKSQLKKQNASLTAYAKRKVKEEALELDLATTIEQNQALQAERDLLRAQVPVPRRPFSLRL